MVTENKQAKFLKVKDRAGNVFLCPLDALKSVNVATEEELENWGWWKPWPSDMQVTLR